MISFDDLDLIAPLRRAVAHENYTQPTPIQAQAIPYLLDGRDVLGVAQTGTGKTAAFALPILQHLARRPERAGRPPIRALVLSPTRELAAQIGESFASYGRFLHIRHMVIFGGVNQTPQVRALERGVDVLVATPGRLLDLLEQGFVDLGHVEFFVLDEADRMLDMGFIRDIRRVLKVLPQQRQNLLFSATMPQSIMDLAAAFLDRPERVEVTPPARTADRVEQSVMFVERTEKKDLLAHLLRQPDLGQALVFTRTKHGANRLVKQLERDGIGAAAIHGNKSQSARTRALDAFRSGDLNVLVATDLASRGLDVDGISHVYNYDLPNEPESYVHRIGRTARAGRSGVAVSFCDETEGEYLRDIEKLTGVEIPVDTDHAWHYPRAIPPAFVPRSAPSRGRHGGGQGPVGRDTRRAAPAPRRGFDDGPRGDRPPPRREGEAAQPAPRSATPRSADGQRNADAGGADVSRPRPADPRPPQPSQAPGADNADSDGARRRRRRGGRGRSRGGPPPTHG